MFCASCTAQSLPDDEAVLDSSDTTGINVADWKEVSDTGTFHTMTDDEINEFYEWKNGQEGGEE